MGRLSQPYLCVAKRGGQTQRWPTSFVHSQRQVALEVAPVRLWAVLAGQGLHAGVALAAEPPADHVCVGGTDGARRPPKAGRAHCIVGCGDIVDHRVGYTAQGQAVLMAEKHASVSGFGYSNVKSRHT